MNDLKSDYPAQPNLDVSSTKRAWSLRFWLVTALTGAAAGLAGGTLMRLLEFVEHVGWDYDAGRLLEAAGRASASRHVLILLAAGLLVGSSGKLIPKTFGRPGEAEASIWFRCGRMPALATLVKAVHTIVTVGMGTSLGRESPVKLACGAIASLIAQWSRLSRAEQRLLVACEVGAGMASAYNVPVRGALFAVEVPQFRLIRPAGCNQSRHCRILHRLTAAGAPGSFHSQPPRHPPFLPAPYIAASTNTLQKLVLRCFFDSFRSARPGCGWHSLPTFDANSFHLHGHATACHPCHR